MNKLICGTVTILHLLKQPKVFFLGQRAFSRLSEIVVEENYQPRNSRGVDFKTATKLCCKTDHVTIISD